MKRAYEALRSQGSVLVACAEDRVVECMARGREEAALMDLFQYATTLRDEGLSRVSREDWMPAAVRTFRRHAAELPDVFTGEDIRELVFRYAGPPHHPNAWGALTMALVKHGHIVATGTVSKMKSPSSHARRTFDYRLAR